MPNWIYLQLVEYGIGRADGDTAYASSLDLGRHEKMSSGLTSSDSVYHVVLDPSNYSELICLLLCETPEPDALNRAMNRVVKPTGHFRNSPSVPSPRPSRRSLNFVTVHRVE